MLPEPTNPATPLSVWLLRLLMATLLLFGSEILLWVDPPSRSLSDWLLLIIGYIVLGALLLDLAVRYRIRDLYDAMTLAALYALYAGLLLNPEIALVDLPRTFMTRVLGTHSLLGLEMFGLFLALTGGANARVRRLLFGYSLWVGFYWGTWGRWSYLIEDWPTGDQVARATMLAYAVGLLAIALLFWSAAVRRSNQTAPSDLRLSSRSWAILLGILVILLGGRISQDAFDMRMLVFTLLLTVLCVGILWFRRPTKGGMLLDAHVPPSPLPIRWMVSTIAIFVGATIFAYQLPRLDIGGYSQIAVMTFGYTGVGLIWLPVVATAVSINALDRLGREAGL